MKVKMKWCEIYDMKEKDEEDEGANKNRVKVGVEVVLYCRDF